MTHTARGMEGIGSIDRRAGMSRRTALLGVAPALLAGTVGATACGALGAGGGGSGGSDSAPPRPGTLKPDVSVPFLQTSGQAEQGMVNQIVDRWKQANPRGPQAEFVISTGDVVEKFTTMLAGGTPPALVSMAASQGVVYADRGEFTALDDYAKRDKYDLADYIPVSLDQYRWKGKLYALV